MTNAKGKDKVRVVSILSNSLINNSWINRLVKQDQVRFKRIEQLIEFLFDHCLRTGRVLISEDRSACALVFFRNKKSYSISLYHSLMLAFKVTGLDRLSQILKLERYIKIAHNAVAGEGQIYHIRLWGVHPSFQGKGSGTKLLLEMLEESKSFGKTLFLETSEKEMLPFYEKIGLKIYHQIDLDGTIYLLKQR
ncbi:GNAT family N-acetyltransferase [Pedobacter punctiformis]|uniref:GNAT family N-acetyltransferase n=1 Tax=Pedobacter punctiformis TaxID=3004097 RepID=A0ABT4L8X0_9SPHI|nr:GNAT family N-acetyltransferase [Pedobacter sp. HCMS5-2]MCZ4244157.1 GNAT family N-acetyltransferase [Pedobacter sp. HCMS5-2]